ncbi:phosphate ABC transporter permease subunit PstC [Hyphomicrobiales bacterium 4NK60-0047b]
MGLRGKVSEVLSLYVTGFLTYILPPVIVIGIVYFIGKWKAQRLLNNRLLTNQGQAKNTNTAANASSLHSRPPYHGAFLALISFLPAVIVFCAWSIAEGPVIKGMVNSTLPASVSQLDAGKQDLISSVIGTVENGLKKLDQKELALLDQAAKGDKAAVPVEPEAVRKLFEGKNIILAENPEAYVLSAALKSRSFTQFSTYGKYALFILMSIASFMIAYSSIKLRLRARNGVETIVKWFLILASIIAIVTTFGILFSVLFETINFFQIIPPSNFFFGTVWDPRFGWGATGGDGNFGQYGFLPLLWGTLYISFVALFVAVPVGLFAAIYMSEYAGSKLRSIAKPALEILAGIPTIVYGFFALVTLGPFFRDAGAIVGLEINASSVLTAGFVMGIMLIPFISSLSDDIINAVPQSLREGSLGLGSTKSETITKVVLPAALPGLVGAVMLAASRAIGETMIVVLAAGIAAKLHMNPFDALTTITVKIVNQLTGDHEFGSPETLVAFALGLSLFIITLMLNVYALYIVRKYREQYD